MPRLHLSLQLETVPGAWCLGILSLRPPITLLAAASIPPLGTSRNVGRPGMHRNHTLVSNANSVAMLWQHKTDNRATLSPGSCGKCQGFYFHLLNREISLNLEAPQRLFNKTFVYCLPATSDNISLSDSFYDLTLNEKVWSCSCGSTSMWHHR